jgi:hypothetical protein
VPPSPKSFSKELDQSGLGFGYSQAPLVLLFVILVGNTAMALYTETTAAAMPLRSMTPSERSGLQAGRSRPPDSTTPRFDSASRQTGGMV